MKKLAISVVLGSLLCIGDVMGCDDENKFSDTNTNLTFDDLVKYLRTIPRDDPYVLVSAESTRSGRVMQAIAEYIERKSISAREDIQTLISDLQEKFKEDKDLLELLS